MDSTYLCCLLKSKYRWSPHGSAQTLSKPDATWAAGQAWASVPCPPHCAVVKAGMTLSSPEHTCKITTTCTNNILHQGPWCWGSMLIDTCRLTDVSATTAELGHGCLTLVPGWEEMWIPLQLLFLLSFTVGLFTSCYRHNSSLTLGEELASSFLLPQGTSLVWISLPLLTRQRSI